MASRFDYITEVLDRAVEEAQLIDVKGRVVQVVGTIIKASVPGVKVGEVCILRDPWENVEMQAEVIGFNKETVLLTALGQMTGLSVETEVIPTRRVHMVSVGESLLGRVLDGLGRPIDSDEKGPLLPEGYYPVYADPPNPLERRIISKPISLGVKALDAMLTCGEGQRMGIFALTVGAADAGSNITEDKIKVAISIQSVRHAARSLPGCFGVRARIPSFCLSNRFIGQFLLFWILFGGVPRIGTLGAPILSYHISHAAATHNFW